MLNRLKELRKEKGISQFKLSVEAKINSAKLSHVENHLTDLTPPEKQRVAQSLRVSVEEIWPEGSHHEESRPEGVL